MSCAPYIICNITTSVSNLGELAWLSTFFFFFFLSMLTPHLVQFIKVTWCTHVHRQLPPATTVSVSRALLTLVQLGVWTVRKAAVQASLVFLQKTTDCGRFLLYRMSATHTQRPYYHYMHACTYIPSAQPVWLVEARFPYLSYWHCSDPMFYQDRRTWLDW